jgi:hypothetical protein
MRTFQDDTPEMRALCARTDVQHMTVFSEPLFTSLEERDKRLVEHMVKEYHFLAREIYHLIQGKSIEYPRVDAQLIYTHLVTKLSPQDEISFQSFLSLVGTGQEANIRRFHLMEFFIRLAAKQK